MSWKRIIATKDVAKTIEEGSKRDYLPIIEIVRFSHSYISEKEKNFYILRIINSGHGPANNLCVYLDNTLLKGSFSLGKGAASEIEISDSKMIQTEPKKLRIFYNDFFGKPFNLDFRLNRDKDEYQIREQFSPEL